MDEKVTLSQRAYKLKPSPTLALAAQAKALAAKGFDVISLSLGEPDWDTLDGAKRAGIEAIQSGYSKYTPANGIPELRAEICKRTKAEISVDYDINDVTVSAGGKFILFGAFQVLLSAGDEVLIPAPYWVSYPTMVELADGVPVIVETEESNRFKMTASELSRAITPKTKLLVLNSPSNPTGEMYSKNELNEIAEVLRKHPHVAIISDDIYNRLAFNPEGLAPHLLQVAPDLKNRTLVVNGASKTFAMTGWRLGWALGPKHIIEAMTNYQSQSVSCATSMSQKAAIAALQAGEEELRRINQRLQERRDFALQSISQLKGVQAMQPEGAFYIWLKISSVFGKRYKDTTIQNSQDFAKILLQDFYVASVPGIEFGCEGYLRVSYVLSQDKMKAAFERIGQLLQALR